MRVPLFPISLILLSSVCGVYVSMWSSACVVRARVCTFFTYWCRLSYKRKKCGQVRVKKKKTSEEMTIFIFFFFFCFWPRPKNPKRKSFLARSMCTWNFRSWNYFPPIPTPPHKENKIIWCPAQFWNIVTVSLYYFFLRAWPVHVRSDYFQTKFSFFRRILKKKERSFSIYAFFTVFELFFET